MNSLSWLKSGLVEKKPFVYQREAIQILQNQLESKMQWNVCIYSALKQYFITMFYRA